MDEQTCGYCGEASTEPLNHYGVHDYCLCDPDEHGAKEDAK